MAKPRILVVDDEAAIRFAIRDFLELNGYDVDEAETCAEAEARYRRDVYDLVTLDYSLQDGNALDCCPGSRPSTPACRSCCSPPTAASSWRCAASSWGPSSSW